MYARIICRTGAGTITQVVGSETADLSIRTDPGQAMVMLHPRANGPDQAQPPKAVALLTADTLVSIIMSEDKPSVVAGE